MMTQARGLAEHLDLVPNSNQQCVIDAFQGGVRDFTAAGNSEGIDTLFAAMFLALAHSFSTPDSEVVVVCCNSGERTAMRGFIESCLIRDPEISALAKWRGHSLVWGGDLGYRLRLVLPRDRAACEPRPGSTYVLLDAGDAAPEGENTLLRVWRERRIA